MSKRLEHEKVAIRYAKALFESVSPEDLHHEAAKDLSAINLLFSSGPEFSRFFENPGIPQQEKISFVEQQLGQAVHPKVSKLLVLLLQNNRLMVFPLLVEQFFNLIHRHENTTQAEVITAVEIEPDLSDRLRALLESAFGFQRVDLKHRIDPVLLGGVVVKMQDQIIDGSYLGRLESLRQQISMV